MRTDYGGNPHVFGHQDYEGAKRDGRSIKDIYNYINSNQGSLYEGNRYGGYAGLSDQIRNEYRDWERQDAERRYKETQAREAAARKQREADEKAKADAEAAKQKEAEQIANSKSGGASKSYISLNFDAPSYERNTGEMEQFNSDFASKYLENKRSSISSGRKKSDSDYGLNLRREAKDRSNSWLKSFSLASSSMPNPNKEKESKSSPFFSMNS